MQIFPDSSNSRVGDTLSSVYSASSNATPDRDSFGFSKLFEEAYENTPAEVTPSLEPLPFEDSDSQQTDSSLLATDDPYMATESVAPSALNTAASVPTAEIHLTDAELNKVAENMRKEGVDAATIQRVRDLAGKPGGVSVAEVIKAVANEEPARLTESDLHSIKSLTDRIDHTGALGESILHDLRDGKVTQAWASIMQALKNADPNTVMDIDRSEVLSLGKAMRLGEGVLGALSKSFAGGETLSLTPDGFKALMVPAQQSILETETARHKLALSMETAFKPVIKEARERLESEALATGRTSRRTQQSELLIQETVTKHSFARENEVASKGTEQRSTENQKTTRAQPAQNTGQPSTTAQSSVAAQPGTTAQPGTVGEPAQTPLAQVLQQATQVTQVTRAEQQTAAQIAGKTSASDAATTERPVGQATPTAISGQAVPPVSGRAAENGQSGKDGKEGKDSGQGKNAFGGSESSTRNINGLTASTTVETPANPWDALLQRLDVAHTPGTVVMNGITPDKLSQLQTPTPLSGRVLSQVEQGMLSAMRDGTKRLELQLNPLDLGVVNVLLTSRNGEVSAMLRPERPETASMLIQQMEQLRVNLEAQGLKVDKVDVQTQLKDDSGTSWQGMEQHNSSQEQQSRQFGHEQMRRLGRARQNDASLSAVSPELATLSRTGTQRQGLNIVA